MFARSLCVVLTLLIATQAEAQTGPEEAHLLVQMVWDTDGIRIERSTRVGFDLPRHRKTQKTLDPLSNLWDILQRHSTIRGEFHNPSDPRKIDSFAFPRKKPVRFTIRLPLSAQSSLDLPKDTGGQPRQPTYDVEVLQDMGDPANRVDIVILGDGYRVEDQQKLSDDVTGFLQTFWSYASIGEYQNYFNIKLVHVISNENGADNGSYGAERDTALGAYYGCYGIDRLICLANEAVLYDIVNSHAPESDNIFVVVNDPKYGGAGGYYSVFSVNDVYGPLGEVAMHEYGHTMGNLADEYEDPYPGYPGCTGDCPEPNVTTRTNREEVKWNPWILPETPVPTPQTGAYQDVVGVFEGARYQYSGVYRPKQNCLMRYFGVGFCEVCAEAMVLSFYDQVSPIDDVAPASPIQLSGCDEIELSVSYPVPQPDSMRFTWKLDGVELESGRNPSYLLKSAALGNGNFQVSVEVEDATLLVRTDPYSLLTAGHSWTVAVTDAGLGACIIGDDCYPDQTINPQNSCQICNTTQNPQGWTNDDARACDDSDPCTGADVCNGGACVGTNIPGCCVDDSQCDDGIPCTRDSCDLTFHECQNSLSATNCLIEGVCYQNGQGNPEDSCRMCSSGENQVGWTDLPNCPEGCNCAASPGRTGGLLLLALLGLLVFRRRS